MRTLTPWGSMAQTPGVEVSVRRSSLAGGAPFHTTQTKAVEFPGAALSPACRRQAAGEGAGLDAASPQSPTEAPTSVRDRACARSSPHIDRTDKGLPSNPNNANCPTDAEIHK